VARVTTIEPKVAQTAPKQVTEHKSTEQIVREAARTHGIDEAYFVSIAMCESTMGLNLHNPSYVAGDGSSPAGVFQFIRSTYIDFAAKAGYPVQDDRLVHYNNINVAAWAFANNLGSHWECR